MTRLLVVSTIVASVACVGAFSGLGHPPSSRSDLSRSLSGRRANSVHLKAGKDLEGCPEHMVTLDDSNRHEILGGDRPVLVDACAPWCGPCKLIEPVLAKAADKWKTLDFVKYDVESKNASELKEELTRQDVKIKSLPSLVLFMNGKAVASRSGVVNDMALQMWLSRNLHKGRLLADSESEEEEKDGAEPKNSNATAALV